MTSDVDSGVSSIDTPGNSKRRTTDGISNVNEIKHLQVVEIIEVYCVD